MGRKKTEIGQDDFLPGGATLELMPDTPPEMPPDSNPSETPMIGDLGWTAHILSLLDKDTEIVEGHPNVHGLRRVAAMVLGKLLSSSCQSYFCGTSNSWVGTCDMVFKDNEQEKVAYSDTACVNSMNCEEKYRRFGAECAATRAESRVLRKALLLNVISSEENAPSVNEIQDSDSADKPIDDSQVNVITRVVARNQIDLKKLLALPDFKLGDIREATHSIAQDIIKKLNKIQNDGKVPDNLKA